MLVNSAPAQENFALPGARAVEYMNHFQDRTCTRPCSRAKRAQGHHGGRGDAVNDSTRKRPCFTNIPQKDGGTHPTGLRAAMTREQVHRGARVGEGRSRDHWRHARPACALSVKVRAEVLLADQGKLVSSEVRPVVEESSRKLREYLTSTGGRAVITSRSSTRRAREAARKARRRAARACWTAWVFRASWPLPEKDPRSAAVSGRGRLGRRSAKRGRDRVSGDPAAEGQDPECREARFDKLLGWRKSPR